MPTLDGAEIQHVADGSWLSEPDRRGRFYRLVRLGGEVHFRWGKRGACGRMRRLAFSTEAEAMAAYDAQKAIATRGRADLEIFSCHLDEVPSDVVDAEELFCDRWRAAMLGQVGAGRTHPRGYWAVFDNLVAEAAWDPGAGVLLGHLQAGPWAMDPARDRVVAQVGAFRRGRGRPGLLFAHEGGSVVRAGNVAGYRWTAAVLGNVQAGDDRGRMAELLVGMLGDDGWSIPLEQRAQTLGAARRLVLAHA